MSNTFRLFVYGVLKREGEGVPAMAVGNVKITEMGYRMLSVPPESVLARGNPEDRGDADRGRLWDNPPNYLPCPDDYGLVYGKLIERTRSDIRYYDAFEGFAGDNSAYRRVLVWVQTEEEMVAAWVYVGSPVALQALEEEKND